MINWKPGKTGKVQQIYFDCCGKSHLIMIKIAILIDSKNNWIDNYFTKRTFKSSSKFNFNIFKNQKKIKKYDIVFVLDTQKF